MAVRSQTNARKTYTEQLPTSRVLLLPDAILLVPGLRRESIKSWAGMDLVEDGNRRSTRGGRKVAASCLVSSFRQSRPPEVVDIRTIE